MKSSKLFQTAQITAFFCLTSLGASAQLQPDPAPSVKGRWGLSTGFNLDSYKRDITLTRPRKSVGLLPMVTYTYGKNQFELGPQFLLSNYSDRRVHRYFGMNFNYKRYFNGFGNRFVPYLFTGVGFSTTSSNTVVESDGVSTGRYPFNYKQTGFNLGVGYGLEWQLGNHFYLGSSVSLNAAMFSIRKSHFTNHPDYYWDNPQLSNENRFKFDFNVNAQIGYRFGGR